jgi:hypothetical protein
MKRDAWQLGVGIAAAWLATGLCIAAEGPGVTWMSVFAFLTAGAVANSHNETARGVAATVWWTAAGVLVLLFGGGFAWLSVIAFVLTAASIGIGGFDFPKRLEWDLWDRDDDSERVKVVR